MTRPKEAYVLFNDSEPRAIAEVKGFAAEAAGNIERFQELFRERFNYAALIFKSGDPILKKSKPETMIRIMLKSKHA